MQIKLSYRELNKNPQHGTYRILGPRLSERPQICFCTAHITVHRDSWKSETMFANPTGENDTTITAFFGAEFIRLISCGEMSLALTL